MGQPMSVLAWRRHQQPVVLKSDMPWKVLLVVLTQNLFSLSQDARLMMIVMNLKLRLLLIRSQMPSTLNHWMPMYWMLIQSQKKQLRQQKTVLMVDVNWQDYLIDTVGLMDELIVVPTKEAGVLALET